MSEENKTKKGVREEEEKKKKKSFRIETDQYFKEFISKTGLICGIRYGNENDAEELLDIIIENYGFEYVFPWVYNLTLLRKELNNVKKLWFLAESIEKKEILAFGIVEIEDIYLHAGTLMVRKKYANQGITNQLTNASGLSLMTNPKLKNKILKAYSDNRANIIKTQALAYKRGAIPIAFIPNYTNFGDFRHYDINKGPNPPIREEGTFFFVFPLKSFWRKRIKNIVLFDNKNIIFFYNFVKQFNPRMKNDILIIKKDSKILEIEEYKITKNAYCGRVNLSGYIKEQTLHEIIEKHQNWRMIIWRIPTTEKGIPSMILAIKKKFGIVGYDIGCNIDSGTINDSIIFVRYFKRLEHIDVDCIDILKPIVQQVKTQFFLT